MGVWYEVMKDTEEEEQMNTVQLNKDILKDTWRNTSVHRETADHTHHVSSPYMK